MKATIVYSFAVESGLVPPDGALPLDLLARQIPRQIVATLNGVSDQGVRFFPLMGFEGQRRRFFTIDELLPPEAATKIHRQADVDRLVHGRIEEGGVRVRIVDANGSIRGESRVAFDPAEPLLGVARLAFALGEELGLAAATYRGLQLPPAAVAPYLQARDGLLALDANLLVEDPAGLVAPALEALEWAPRSADVRELVLQLGARMLGQSLAPRAVAALLARAAVVGGDDPAFVESAARVLDSAGMDDDAASLHRRLASQPGAPTQSVWRAAASAFSAGRVGEADELLRVAVEGGDRSSLLLTQWAIVVGSIGRLDQRDRLMDEVVAKPLPTPSVARIAAIHLVDRQRFDEAIALLRGQLELHPTHGGIWFEYGRALLGAGRGDDARAAFDRCLMLDPTPSMRSDVRRLLRFADDPKTLAGVQSVDDALRRGDANQALQRVKALLRRNPALAEGWLFLGTIRQRLSHPRRAMRALRRALALAPDLGEAHDRLGILLVSRGDARAGHEHLRRAVELLPDHASPRIHLAQACRFLGLAEEGLAALDDAERLGGPIETITAVRRAFADDAT
jgi:tetratricopeptide (TPR) repeat protein